jgi:hypothetical protein
MGELPLGTSRTELWGERSPEEADQWRRWERQRGITSGTKEKREEEKREERGGWKAALQFKFGPIVPTRLTRLSRATCSGATGGHMSQGGWAISYVTAVSATQSHQTPWSDWGVRGTMSPTRHAPAPWFTSVHMTRLMSRVNQTGSTRKGKILKISFGRVYFSIFLKKTKIKNRIEGHWESSCCWGW